MAQTVRTSFSRGGGEFEFFPYIHSRRGDYYMHLVYMYRSALRKHITPQGEHWAGGWWRDSLTA